MLLFDYFLTKNRKHNDPGEDEMPSGGAGVKTRDLMERQENL